jgi:XXXCH domain-containing protein
MGKDLKTLKKRMGKSFKSFMKKIDKGELPERDLIARWCEDADLMGSLLDQGGEHVHSFKEKCHELLESVEQRQIASAQEAAAALNRMRKECHSRYK